MRRLAVVALVLGAFFAGLIGYAAKGVTPTVTLESQAWWNKTGIVIPSNVGKHIHLTATVPADGAIVNGIVNIPLTIKLHNQTGATDKTNWVRAGGYYSGGGIASVSIPLVLGPCTDCTWVGSINVDFSKWPTGRDELRISANIPSNSEGNRQFQSTGYQVCVRSCTPTYRAAGPYNEARGWYTGHGYANAKLTTPLSTVRSGGTIGVRLSPGSGGLTTKLAGVYIDPNFHAGSSGIVVHQWTAAFTGSVTLPSLSSGVHKLVLVSSDGFDAGVLAIGFTVP